MHVMYVRTNIDRETLVLNLAKIDSKSVQIFRDFNLSTSNFVDERANTKECLELNLVRIGRGH